MTTREAASVLRMTPATLRSWAKAGALPSVRIGARLRFDPDDLAGFINARRSRPAARPTAPVTPPPAPTVRRDLTPVNRRGKGAT